MSTQAKILHKTKRMLMRTRRHIYGLRLLVPGLREHHRLEAMVGPLGFWKELQGYQIHALTTLGLKPEHTLIDIGCGPLQGGIPCIRYLNPNCYTGVDIMPNRIQAAYGQVAREDLGSKNPRILLSNTFGDEELGNQTFDFIWASQILCFFDESKMEHLFQFVKKRLNLHGKFLGDIYSPDHYEFKTPERPGKYFRHTLESLRVTGKNYGLGVTCLGPLEEFKYPRPLNLRTSLLMEIVRTEP